MEDETERMRAELLKKEAELIKLKQMQLDMQILQLKKEMPGQVLLITIYHLLDNKPDITATVIFKKSVNKTFIDRFDTPRQTLNQEAG